MTPSLYSTVQSALLFTLWKQAHTKGSPSAGSYGSVINHVTFLVPNHREAIPAWKAAGATSIFGLTAKEDQESWEFHHISSVNRDRFPPKMIQNFLVVSTSRTVAGQWPNDTPASFAASSCASAGVCTPSMATIKTRISLSTKGSLSLSLV
jgi:hypothetical protein